MFPLLENAFKKLHLAWHVQQHLLKISSQKSPHGKLFLEKNLTIFEEGDTMVNTYTKYIHILIDKIY